MSRGFTIIETVIVVAVVVLLVGIIIIPFKKINDNQALSKETLNIVSVINQARSRTLSSAGGLQHGVHFESDRVVLFAGSTYSSSDPSNVIIPLHPLTTISSISLSGGASSTVFERLTGITQNFGTITLSLVASTTQAKTISISSTGIITASP